GRDVWDAMRDSDLGDALTLPKEVAWLLAEGRRRRGPCGWRSCRRALHARVHIAFVIVANVKNVIIALEHARQTLEANVGCAAIPTLGNRSRLGAAFHSHGGRNTGGNGCRIAEQRMQPRNLPRRFGIRGGEHLEASRGIDGDEIAAGGAQGGVNGVARPESLPTSLASAMPAGKRVRTIDRRLHRSLRLADEAVAHRESPLLVEFEFLHAVD